MVFLIPPPSSLDKISNSLKPYILQLQITNKFVKAEVFHVPSSTLACAASTHEKSIRLCMSFTRSSCSDVQAAAKIGKLLGERLLFKDISVVSAVDLNREHKYHCKVKALIDSLRNTGVKLFLD